MAETMLTEKRVSLNRFKPHKHHRDLVGIIKQVSRPWIASTAQFCGTNTTGFESPLKMQSRTRARAARTPTKEATFGYQAPTMTPTTQRSDYRSPDDESDKPERWLSQLKLTKSLARDGRRATPRPVDKARGSRIPNRGVRATFADSPRLAARPPDYTTRDTAWSGQEVDKGGIFHHDKGLVSDLPKPELTIDSRDREPRVPDTHSCGHRQEGYRSTPRTCEADYRLSVQAGGNQPATDNDNDKNAF